MNAQSRADELDARIEIMLAVKSAQPELAENGLLAIAADCMMLPNPEFQERLRAELLDQAAGDMEKVAGGSHAGKSQPDFQPVASAAALAEILPTLGGNSFGIFPADHRSFIASFLSHAALIALIASGIWVGHSTVMKPAALTSELIYPVAGEGGGGGGERNRVPATKGTAPKFAIEQFTPPMIVVRNSAPKLTMPETVIGPPDINLPQSQKIGDLVSSNIVMPSNGIGEMGSAGSGSHSGLGPGNGPGVGPGSRGGYGGFAYRPSRGITAPRAIYDPEPEYSEEARKVRQQGVVILSLIVDPNGRARDIHVARSLGMGLDEKAVEAVRNWKFQPGMKDGQPVAVQVNIEVNFRLY
jgi:TonB family protein